MNHSGGWTTKAALGFVGTIVGCFGLGMLVTYAIARKVMEKVDAFGLGELPIQR